MPSRSAELADPCGKPHAGGHAPVPYRTSTGPTVPNSAGRSPRQQGMPPGADGRKRLSGGSPTREEMLPWSSTPCRQSRPFPHPRGDAPEKQGTRHNEPGAPPFEEGPHLHIEEMQWPDQAGRFHRMAATASNHPWMPLPAARPEILCPDQTNKQPGHITASPPDPDSLRLYGTGRQSIPDKPTANIQFYDAPTIGPKRSRDKPPADRAADYTNPFQEQHEPRRLGNHRVSGHSPHVMSIRPSFMAPTLQRVPLPQTNKSYPLDNSPSSPTSLN